MAQKAIFCVTHPRACSTAFERVFMTRKDFACAHEPFGDSYYYGPERMSERYDEKGRKESGFANTTYKEVFDRFDRDGAEGKRLFLKDMAYYLFPPNGSPPQIAPSMLSTKRGIGTETNGNKTNGDETNGNTSDTERLPFPYHTHSEPGNPTVVPGQTLKQFHYTFLIRDPHYSIPSYYRCTVPPLDKITGWYGFNPSEVGYDEVRRMFDYLIAAGLVGPKLAGNGEENIAENGVNGANGTVQGVDICVVDADDLLDNPKEMIQIYCKTTGIEYTPDMLHWEDEENQERAKLAFEKWRGWHEDAFDSTELRARAHKKIMKTDEEFDRDWTNKYGLKGANIIRKSVDDNMATYNYLKQFAIKV